VGGGGGEEDEGEQDFVFFRKNGSAEVWHAQGISRRKISYEGLDWASMRLRRGM
jgi:hypothetical protein